jgi:hypothetical protein
LKQVCCHLLVALLFISGLQIRVWAIDAHEMDQHEHAHSDPCHGHEVPSDCDSSHDEDCPEGHHHHGDSCFCGSNPLVSVRDSDFRLIGGISHLLRIKHEREPIPEGPYLSSDRPPLI